MSGCYASCLADCNTRLSREHYISESLLHCLNCDNDLRVNGFSWMGADEKHLPPNALTAKILCERHNSALSPLDSIAARLFQAFDEEGASGSGRQLLYLFSGHDLERWLLKVLCGMAYSRNLPRGVDCDTTIPRQWLEILFGYDDFSNEQGLYVCNVPGHLFGGPTGLAVQVIAGRGRLSGFSLSICGYELILSMSGFPTRRYDGRKFVYRPMEFYTTGPEFEKSIVLSWVGPADLGSIHLEID